MGIKLTSPKVNFSGYQLVPAKPPYPAKHQIKVTDGRMDFYLSSPTIDLSKVPELEPCTLEADVTRVGGGKGFFVFEVASFSASPILKAK